MVDKYGCVTFGQVPGSAHGPGVGISETRLVNNPVTTFEYDVVRAVKGKLVAFGHPLKDGETLSLDTSTRQPLEPTLSVSDINGHEEYSFPRSSSYVETPNGFLAQPSGEKFLTARIVKTRDGPVAWIGGVEYPLAGKLVRRISKL